MDTVLALIITIPYLIGVGWIASIQHRSVVAWVIICIFFPGVGMLYLAYLLSQHTVKCPQCGRMLKVEDGLVPE
ncbi:hypothetical protein LJB99_03795 [Deltaproteobacteria bacterium OttesenSCG-928-K17]|nr:hypothetical protein [Deltaproteobacteria bacterium OttesenSCG-928-K17]